MIKARAIIRAEGRPHAFQTPKLAPNAHSPHFWTNFRDFINTVGKNHLQGA